MYIQSLELKNYRNYDRLIIEFSSGTNILYGDNAQGKTNILEAVYLGATTKSHRGSKDKEIIRFGENESHIRIHLMKQDIGHQIDMHLKKSRTKGAAIDRIPNKRSSDLLGFVPVIFFSPEDLSIIKNGPSERRKFLDIELSQLEKMYLHQLSSYNRVMAQRNNLLKQLAYQRELLDTLDSWDLQLVKYGSEVIRYRQKFIEDLNEIIREIHKNLTGKKEKIVLKYDYSVNYDEFLTVLQRKREIDLKYASTGAGPHRDDIEFLVNGIDIRKFGSQGQQRTAALSLKLAQIELVKRQTGETPILLLDDVLSELDSSRKNYLLDSIKDIQTLITCTGLEEFINSHLQIDKMFQVKSGKIVREN
ncbi:DNA replication/repair protein RecF [Anaerostipes caccae]|uniref:DNA replication/repair protein RecF n=1 Tax=Anaerostipes caccae TaxID=105841 RepID=UPI0039F60490